MTQMEKKKSTNMSDIRNEISNKNVNPNILAVPLDCLNATFKYLKVNKEDVLKNSICEIKNKKDKNDKETSLPPINDEEKIFVGQNITDYCFKDGNTLYFRNHFIYKLKHNKGDLNYWYCLNRSHNKQSNFWQSVLHENLSEKKLY